METTLNNKLIAEFMELPTEIFSSGRLNYGINEAWYELEELSFNIDWNWLMEVVEKIENYNEFTSVLFAPQGCAIDCYVENGFAFSNDCGTKIEAVYNACIKFINWYNENK